MAKLSTGELRRGAKFWSARITLEGRTRKDFALPAIALSDENGARQRVQAMASMAARLRGANRGELVEAVLRDAAKATQGKAFEQVVLGVDALCGPIKQTDAAATHIETVATFAERWVSGELHKRWPDHVRAFDEYGAGRGSILSSYVLPALGTIPIEAVTLDDCDTVLGRLPSHLAQGTRRNVALVLNRLLALAVYPARVLAVNPIPRGWLPSGGKRKAMSSLYPDEDRALLGCVKIPLQHRLTFGILAREGMRWSELAGLRWRDVDLLRGTITLDENKTDDPRAWAMDKGTLRVLQAWHAQEGERATKDSLVIQDQILPQRAAATLRNSLLKAGVDRAELFEQSESRQRIRAHDLRATFVTVSLAVGRSEAWVADRTGHKSSTMINRYRRQARTWAETNLGELAPLDEVIPELHGGKVASASGPTTPAESPKEQRESRITQESAVHKQASNVQCDPEDTPPETLQSCNSERPIAPDCPKKSKKGLHLAGRGGVLHTSSPFERT